ncbi:hypothetical protein JHL18_00500 [Clostridium sp. YIM B02505]|uniref:Uncharacterized protein n=1 Tax=Clostridium yunnanense TaxID=2800325 RepID=A0ABS1EII2_9CLOT|nr:hypothetical protein [Clostridium yunnanense]MBK1809128.1 hypothetical protein [Clostridium yunnanense]
MDDKIKSKLLELVKQLQDILGEDKPNENSKNFILGGMSVLMELVKEK